ncbi:MAG: hypothetical protein QM658_14585 [Gordonia sp. (in: high G+C Gram-positive bacteria)]
MTITIQKTSAGELRERLKGVLSRVDLQEDQLSDLAAKYMLTPEEREAWDEVRSIRFLLGDE